MFSFRQKIFFTYFAVFVVFMALLFPFVHTTVKNIVYKAMEDRATELIVHIQSAPNNDALIRRLKDKKPVIFFRVSVITNERKVLYDSHTKHLLGPQFSQEYVGSPPEVLEDLEKGVGYNVEYSKLLGENFAYMAKRFDFHGKTYVMRTSFPYKYVHEMMNNFEVGFIILLTLVLLLFSAMTWFIINYLIRPIRQIITAIKPFQEGRQTTIPDIKLKPENRKDEFGQLADTFNALKARIVKHIDTLTHERNEKESVLESLVEGVVAVDEKLVVTYSNQTALNLLRMKRDELINRNFSITGQNKLFNLLKLCQKEKKVLTDKLEIKLNGDKYYLDIVAAPQKDGQGAILVMQDKTDKYKVRAMRKDFVANASHELKTPITIIQGFAETLHDNPELSIEITKDITSKITRNCRRMHTLIKDLLTLADIERIPISRLIEFDLYDLANECADNIRKVYPDVEIRVNKVSEQDITLTADPSLIELAITNLLDNAAKYSEQPAKIAVDLEKMDDTIKITIADNGIGIPKEDLEHIFERFYTVNKAKSKKMGGSGLGLSIVQNIIEKHYGNISVQSELGKGTTFTIILRVKVNNSTTMD